jgi:thiol-disulfide isomerase/thioredoxin
MFDVRATDRRRFLGGVGLALAATWLGTRDSVLHVIKEPFRGASGRDLASLSQATAWLNSAPLTAAALRGRVVLVDFCTYTCINWLRTLPYVRAWAQRYQEHGLVVLGVHTPEFSFEEDLANVRRSVNQMRIDYPIAIDNQRAIWRGFANHYWPALYFVDAAGRLRHHHFGEGNYEETEERIRQLLTDAGSRLDGELARVETQGFELGAEWGSLKSPETYVGSQKAENFASPGGPTRNARQSYHVPARLRLNQWALSGEWTVKPEAAVLNAAGGQIAYRFHARDLHLILGPAAPGMPVRFRISLDGQAPGPAHGLDADEDGTGTVREQRLYQLVRQPKPIVGRTFAIDFLDAGVEAFAFTFG